MAIKKDDLTDNFSIFSRVYGLTGSSGSGKSTAATILSSLGAKVISADDLSRQVTRPDGEAFSAIVSAFGEDILLPDGNLDRKKLHHEVFSNPEKLIRLESIIHPIVRQLSLRLAQQAISEKQFPVIYETPLMFEKNLDKEIPFKKIIYISTTEKNAVDRIQMRDGITAEEAKKRIQKQLPDSIKRKKAHILIENNGTVEDFKVKIEALFSEL
jgi:dephospho-CoA kinase